MDDDSGIVEDFTTDHDHYIVVAPMFMPNMPEGCMGMCPVFPTEKMATEYLNSHNGKGVIGLTFSDPESEPIEGGQSGLESPLIDSLDPH